MLYACDLKWWDEYGAEAAGVAAEKWTVDVEGAAAHGLHWIEGIKGQGLCKRPGRVYTGGNSGYQALGLAWQWGAARVVLLGYDMRASGGRTHWHPDHPESLGNVGRYADWVVRFGELARDLAAERVEVINASRATALQCFERKPLEAALRPPAIEDRRMPLFVRGMLGLGDNIYQRAVLREMTQTHRIYLETAWPELYADLDIVPVRPETRLRTQLKNVKTSGAQWGVPPRRCHETRLNYAGQSGTILEALESSAGLRLDRVRFDLPKMPFQTRKPYVIVRPATVRNEWRAEGRNPLPEHIAAAARRLQRDFTVISVADLADGQEWPVGELPPADERFHSGELSVTDLLGLVAGSAGVIGGVGWLVPAAIALRVPMLLLFGGWGFHNGPERIFDRRLDTSLITKLLPKRFCMCSRRDHACDKTIEGIDEHIERWAVGLNSKPRPAMAA